MFAETTCWVSYLRLSGSEISTPNLDRLAASGGVQRHATTTVLLPVAGDPADRALPDTGRGRLHDVGRGGVAIPGRYLDSPGDDREALGQVGSPVSHPGKLGTFAPKDRLDQSAGASRLRASYCQMGGGDHYRPIRTRTAPVRGNPERSVTTTSPTLSLLHAIESIRTFRGSDRSSCMSSRTRTPPQAPESAIEPYRGRYAMGWDDCVARSVGPARRTSTSSTRSGSTRRTELGTVRSDRHLDPERQASRMEVYAARGHLDGPGTARSSDTSKLGLRRNPVLFLSDKEPAPKTRRSGSAMTFRRSRAADDRRQHPGIFQVQQHLPERQTSRGPTPATARGVSTSAGGRGGR